MCNAFALRVIVLVLAVISVEAFTASNVRSSSNVKKNSYLSAINIANPLKRSNMNKKKTNMNIIHVESIQEYKEKVVNEKKCISVVRFYSRYCKSCQASEPHFYKLASEFSQDSLHGSISVNFVEVPLKKHTSILHEALEVPSLPWTHIYHPDAGLVEERAVSKKYIKEVRKCLRCYVYGECELDDAPADCKNVYGECDIE
mmetsp:Transcript_799/g.1678  ORF Transcript_799/g.1678 Transcript_799/m.1678 type:complete len:201 (+) Transcript_799:25-627(+)